MVNRAQKGIEGCFKAAFEVDFFQKICQTLAACATLKNFKNARDFLFPQKLKAKSGTNSILNLVPEILDHEHLVASTG